MKKLLIIWMALLLVSCSPSALTAGQSLSAELPPFSGEEGELGVVVEGVCRYTVIRGENASQRVRKAAKSLDTYLFHHLDTHIGIKNDLAEESSLEILVGVTNRRESQSTLRELRENEYTVRQVGDKIVICGYTDAATEKAVEWFLKTYIKNKDVKEGEKPRLLLDLKDGYTVKPGNAMELPFPENLQLLQSRHTQMGYEFSWQAEPAQAEAYLSRLQQEGFLLLQQQKWEGNLFCSLKRSLVSLLLSYDKGSSRLLLCAEKNLPLAEQAPAFGEVLQLSFLKKEGELAYLFRLTDGFVVVGGGRSLKAQIADALGDQPVLSWLCPDEASLDCAKDLEPSARIDRVFLAGSLREEGKKLNCPFVLLWPGQEFVLGTERLKLFGSGDWARLTGAKEPEGLILLWERKTENVLLAKSVGESLAASFLSSFESLKWSRLVASSEWSGTRLLQAGGGADCFSDLSELSTEKGLI